MGVEADGIQGGHQVIECWNCVRQAVVSLRFHLVLRSDFAKAGARERLTDVLLLQVGDTTGAGNPDVAAGDGDGAKENASRGKNDLASVPHKSKHLTLEEALGRDLERIIFV